MSRGRKSPRMIVTLFPCDHEYQNFLTFMIVWVMEVSVIVAYPVENDSILSQKQEPPEVEDSVFLTVQCIYSYTRIDVKF